MFTQLSQVPTYNTRPSYTCALILLLLHDVDYATLIYMATNYNWVICSSIICECYSWVDCLFVIFAFPTPTQHWLLFSFEQRLMMTTVQIYKGPFTVSIKLPRIEKV
jgi:hypothetical protein